MGHGHGEIPRDENGIYVVNNEGAGKIVQNIEAQTPEDLKQQIDNIETKGRAECACNFTSAEVIAVLREYNDKYKNRGDLLEGWSQADGSKIPGWKGEHLVSHSGASNRSMAFVFHCSDGVKLLLLLQVNVWKVRDANGVEREELHRTFNVPPANDKVTQDVLDIRNQINDTMYVDKNLAAAAPGDGKQSVVKPVIVGSKTPVKPTKKPSLLRRVLKSILGLRRAA